MSGIPEWEALLVELDEVARERYRRRWERMSDEGKLDALMLALINMPIPAELERES